MEDQRGTIPSLNNPSQGMANEKIAATAIDYYDSENIEGDCLNFRQSVELVCAHCVFLVAK